MSQRARKVDMEQLNLQRIYCVVSIEKKNFIRGLSYSTVLDFIFKEVLCRLMGIATVTSSVNLLSLVVNVYKE